MQAGQGSPEAAFLHLLRGHKALPPSSDTGIHRWLWQSLWSPAPGDAVLGVWKGDPNSTRCAWDISRGPLAERMESCSADAKPRALQCFPLGAATLWGET